MKIVILFFAACLALVNSEGCLNEGDCDYEHCTDNNWEIFCDHGTISTILGRPLGDGTCTCVQKGSIGASCTTRLSCDHTTCPSLGGRFDKHCVNGHCMCTFNTQG